MKKNIILILFMFFLIIIKTSESFAQYDWLYPRYNLENTAAIPSLVLNISEEPIEVWSITIPSGSQAGANNAVGDLDGDDLLEIIAVINNIQSQTTSLWVINSEDGSILWDFNVDDQWGLGSSYAGPYIIDLENNGSLEIIFASQYNIFSLNGDDGTVIWNDTIPAGVMGMTVTDINKDGIADIITNDYGNPSKIYLLDGIDGGELWSSETSGSAYNIPTAGDIDGDGDKEILCHNHLYNPSREREYCWDKNGIEKWHFDASPTQEQFNNAPPELGYPPDYGYTASIMLDFDNDDEKEVAFGTSCNYYLLNKDGVVEWKTPMKKGHGVYIIHYKDGSTYVDEHGIGGPRGNAAAGDLNGDNIIELVISLGVEGRYEEYQDSIFIKSEVIPSNKVIALNGNDGSLLWEFEGVYNSPDSAIETMSEPLLVDLDGGGLLDVLVHSTDGHFYGVKGTTGEQIWQYATEFILIDNFIVFGEQNEGFLLINNTMMNKIMLWSFGSFNKISDQKEYQIKTFELSQNYPNPFNPSTKISYSISQPDFISLKIYNMLGQEVEMLVNTVQQAGDYNIHFNAKNLSSGIYFYKLQVGEEITEIKKMILVK